MDEVKLTPVDVIDPGINGLILADTLTYSTKNDTIIKYVVLKDTTSVSHLLSFEISSYYGIGQQNTLVMVNQMEGNFKLIEKKLYAQVKIPYSIITGKLGTTNGLSDVTMSLSYIAFIRPKSNLSLALGVKIPSNSSNLSLDNRPLPMVYQTSLGSTDLLLGSRFSYKKWDFTAGYQHSFNGNSNQYLHINTTGDNLNYNGYFESRNVRRADDALFRINRRFKAKKIVLSTSLLFIYHLADDHITNASGERVNAAGSKGLTLNLDLAGSIPVSKRTSITFVLAKPVVQRKNVTDGLSRSFVGIVGLRWNF